jgi:osmotically-inducible protein OsmY
MCKRLYGGGLLAVATMLALVVPQYAAAATSVTGCLGKTGQGFSLDASGKRLELTGDLDFAKHAGHTVKVTGEGSGGSFRATALEHVSPKCDASVSSSSAAVKPLTASDQGNSEADVETTSKIRRAIVADDTLSISAHNVTIVTRDGKVTLRGDVLTMQEKASVAAKAEAAAGAPVDNQLTVKAGSEKSTQERR